MKTFTTLVGFIVLLAFAACAPTGNATADSSVPAAEPSPEVAATAEPEPTQTPGVLSINYMDAATALAADDIEKAKVSLTALAKESSGELQTLAQAAADTGDIAAMRERFKPLSALAVTMELPGDHAVAFCPMFKGGAKWVQKKGKLANPYYGSTMLTCGSFVN